MRRVSWLLLCVLVPVLAYASAGADKHVKHKQWSTAYDRFFRKYAKHYFGPHVDWHWFKAQGIAESGLDPKAKSRAGAVGIMQILPSTYQDIRKKTSFPADIHEPRWNIAAGIFYNRQLYRKWKRKPEIHNQDHLMFAFGSYNAGYRNILKARRHAQKKHKKPLRWQQVARHAPTQTRAYVRRIQRLMHKRLDAG